MHHLNVQKRECNVFGGDEYFDKLFGILNPEFVAAFQSTRTMYDVMREFIYATDHLDELSKLPGFKEGKMLNNGDVDRMGPNVRNVFNSFAKSSKDNLWRIVPVNNEVTESITDFFKEDYITMIYLMMLRMCNSEIEFKIGSFRYFVSISSESPHFSFAVLDYIDVSRKVHVRIPFLKERLRSAIRMQ